MTRFDGLTATITPTRKNGDVNCKSRIHETCAVTEPDFPIVFPSLPDKYYQLYVFLGISAVVASFTIPTSSYELWQDAEADRDRQAAIVETEQAYLADLEEWTRSRNSTDEDAKFLMDQKRELGKQKAELKWLNIRKDQRRKRFEKANLWAYVVGIPGLVLACWGAVLWWRHESGGKDQP